MTNEKAIYFLDKRKKELLEKQDSKEGFEFIKALAEIRSLEMAIKALEQQPSEDCISRKYIEPIVEELENICINGDEHILSLLSNIKNAPPVTPKYTDEEIDKIQEIEQAYVDKMVELAVEETKRPKGKWIDDCGGVKCSCCGYSIDDDHYAKAYCTNCGAEMSGGEEDEVNN